MKTFFVIFTVFLASIVHLRLARADTAPDKPEWFKHIVKEYSFRKTDTGIDALNRLCSRLVSERKDFRHGAIIFIPGGVNVSPGLEVDLGGATAEEIFRYIVELQPWHYEYEPRERKTTVYSWGRPQVEPE